MQEKHDVIDKLIKDHEQLAEEYRELLKKETEKADQLQKENFELREKMVVQTEEIEDNMQTIKQIKQ